MPVAWYTAIGKEIDMIRSTCAVLLLVFSGLVSASHKWPEIPKTELALSSVPGYPEATAVVLLNQGRIELSGKTLSAFADIYHRVKILKPEGREFGTVSIFSSDYYRMKKLAARIHLPDGTIRDLSKDALFTKKYSAGYDRYVTSFVLPEVTAGSIVEYRYRLYFDSILFPTPWFFQDQIPTLRSQVTCSIPKNYAFKPQVVRTVNRNVEHETKGSAVAVSATFAMNNMPPVPQEPDGPPFEELASRVTFLPIAMMEAGRVPLLDSWRTVCKLVRGDRTYGYQFVRKHAATARMRSRKLTKDLADPRGKAAVIYRYVRDTIATDPFDSVSASDRQADEILASEHGEPIEKALLLQVMLDAAKIDGFIGWTRSKQTGPIISEVVNPGQFDAVLVGAVISGKVELLDVAERQLPFGFLPPELQGVACLRVDKKKPTWMTTPALDAAASLRKAAVSLTVSPTGLVSGDGTLVLTGNQALSRMDWKETEEKTRIAWKDWIAGQFPDYDIEEVALAQERDVPKISVTFSVAERVLPAL